jgi:hypothetical protein
MIKIENDYEFSCDCGNYSYSDDPNDFKAIATPTEQGLMFDVRCLKCGEIAIKGSLPGRNTIIKNMLIFSGE